MKHILSFLFLLGFTYCITAQDTSATVKCSLEDLSILRNGFSIEHNFFTASVYTVSTKDYTHIKNWFIKSTLIPNLSLFFGTAGIDGIASFARNPDFAVQSRVLHTNPLNSIKPIPSLPGLQSSSMKPLALAEFSIPFSSSFSPSITFFYSAIDLNGLYNESTESLSLTLPLTLTPFSASTSFTAFSYLRKSAQSSSWYSPYPYSEDGRYFFFTNAAVLRFPFLNLSVLSAMSEISESRWKYSCLGEARSTITVKKGKIFIGGKAFICDYDFITLGSSKVRTVLHFSLNPRIQIPLNKKNTTKLSLGLTGDYQKKYTPSLPPSEENVKAVKAAAELASSFYSLEVQCGADNVFSPSFIGKDTCALLDVTVSLSFNKFSPIPLTYLQKVSFSHVPLNSEEEKRTSTYSSVEFTSKGKTPLTISAGVTFDFLSGPVLALYGIQTKFSYKNLNASASFTYDTKSGKYNSSAALSFRTYSLY